MKISAIHIYNFKSYKDLTKIECLDERLSDKQNIILVGGLNGAGKTSFLESLYLCFYGRDAENLYPSKGAKNENYDNFLVSCLNDDIKASGIVNPRMYIEIFLSGVKLFGNFPKNISLRREWNFSLNGNAYQKDDEDFLINENGAPIEGLPSSEYEDKIQFILPKRVAQFFFFDGEKIQDFAADADSEFADSLKDVLGISLYSQLAEDIREVKRRILREYNKNKELNDTLDDRRNSKRKLERAVDNAQIEINSLLDELAELRNKKEKIDAQTFRTTRISADSRDEYLRERENKEIEKETLAKEYIDTAKDYLPFILANDLCNELEDQLNKEAEYLEFESTQKRIEPEIEGITNAILDQEPQCPQPLTTQQKKFYEWKIDDVIRKFLVKPLSVEIGQLEIIHQFSNPDRLKIIDMLGRFNRDIVHMLQRKAERLKRIDLDLQRIRQTESKSGGTSEGTLKLFEEKDQILMTIGEKNERIRQLEHEIAENERQVSELERHITNLESKVEVHEKQRKQLDYSDKMIRTIADFQTQFQAKRTKELEIAIMEMWNLLAQKEGQVERVEIIPERNFEVRLYDANDREKDKTKLSAGEKEIYAISLLWALVQVSGKQMPIVIDTPYGRLDSIHRENLARYYFPKASHQVFLLSQDKEIVEEYYEILKPAIASEFSITYNSNTRKSEVAKGYKFA